jgi:hypothetical protein
MSSSDRLEPILTQISKDINSDVSNVLKCSEIASKIENFYAKDIDQFLEKHQGLLGRRIKPDLTQRMGDVNIRLILHGANFYFEKAKEYFEFFGVDFDKPEKSGQFVMPTMKHAHLSHFLYSSVQLLYVILWEVLQDFLKPLENMYLLRLCDSKIFHKKCTILPAHGEIGAVNLDFIYDVSGGGSPLYRASGSLPFTFRLSYLSSDYFRKCFEEAGKEIGERPENFIDDFISLSVVRNNISHIGRAIKFQEISQDAIQKHLYRLSTHLPKIQNSCIGIVTLFKFLANSEPESEA